MSGIGRHGAPAAAGSRAAGKRARWIRRSRLGYRAGHARIDAEALRHAGQWRMRGAAALDGLRRFGARHHLLVDLGLAVATGTVSLLIGTQQPPVGVRPFDAMAVALTCVATASLVARQFLPVTVTVFFCAVWALYVHLGYWAVVNSPGVLLALYTVAALRSPRITVAMATFGCMVWLYAAPGDPVVALAQAVVWMAVVTRFGYNTQLFEQRGVELARLADRLAAEQEDRTRRAVVEERLHIARELHDVVAHHMSVVSVQAGLAQYVLDRDRDTARSSIATVLQTSGEALEEMRRMLAVLRPGAESTSEDDRAPGEPYAPAPGLAQLDDAVERVRGAGVPVTVAVTGQPRRLAPGLDTCVYRVVQESLTNVLKHAAPASVNITLAYGEDRLAVRVVDDGRHRTVTEPRGASSGQGINGMRERARLYGGTLTAGPRAEGGFEVALVVPVPDPTG